ncbi:hypothetical protein Tco_0271718 [Tanacetum coccineum]
MWQTNYLLRALKNKGIVDSGCSRHMTGNKAYLAEFQDFNGGPVTFGGSKGYITGKGSSSWTLRRNGLVRGLPKLKYHKDYLCSACAMGKSKKQTLKPKDEDSNKEKLYLLHMDLCGPMRVQSVNRKWTHRLSNKEMTSDTIPSIENLVPIPSEFKGIFQDMCDVPICKDPSTFDALSNHSEILSDYSTSSDDNSYENIDYRSSSSQSPENFHTIIESLPISTTRIEDSDPNREEIDIFSRPDDLIPPGIESDFDSEEDIIDNLLNGNPTHERLTFNIKPDAPVINNVDELNEDECFDPGGGENNVEVDDSFTFVTWTFLPFLTYPEVSPLLSSTKNEDTIYDPDISI